MSWLRGIVILVVVAALVLLLAAQLGALRGSEPRNLGLREGKLKLPSKTPNSVSSQADLWPDHPQRDYARIAPLAITGDVEAAWARLRDQLASTAGARVVRADGDYLYAQFSTRWLKFTDDAEFWLDRPARVIHLRSASRLGRKDYGANRARMEALRARFEAR